MKNALIIVGVIMFVSGAVEDKNKYQGQKIYSAIMGVGSVVNGID